MKILAAVVLTAVLTAVLVVLLPRAPASTDSGDGPPRPALGLDRCRVTRIVDGDTLDCDPVGRVRLVGIDAPERGQRPFGTEAGRALERLTPVQSEVFLEADVEDRDRYGRALRYVWVDDVMVNWAMVRQGYAVLLTYPPNVQYVEWLRRAEDAASEAERGLWAEGGFDCRPLAYRREMCR